MNKKKREKEKERYICEAESQFIPTKTQTCKENVCCVWVTIVQILRHKQ
jgi:hypothetical protein